MKKNKPGVGLESLLATYRFAFRFAVKAAVRAAGMYAEVTRVRARLASFAEAVAKSVGEASDAILDGELVPRDRALDILARFFDLGVVDTAAAHKCLGYLRAQVAELNGVYREARAENAVAAFRALREVSRVVLADRDEEVGKAWRYACSIWREFDVEGPRVALWQPGLPDGQEDRFKFDEAAGTWTYERDDGTRETLGDSSPASPGK